MQNSVYLVGGLVHEQGIMPVICKFGQLFRLSILRHEYNLVIFSLILETENAHENLLYVDRSFKSSGILLSLQVGLLLVGWIQFELTECECLDYDSNG